MTIAVEQIVIVSNSTGIHARPAVKLSKLAKSFLSEIMLKVDTGEDWISAKSTRSVIKLKARSGANLTVKANGSDAADAVKAIVDLVEQKFGE